MIPGSTDESGIVTLLCTDPLEESLRQEAEQCLGRPVRPHLALQLYLARAMQAALQLRQECEDACLLVGDQLDADAIDRTAHFLHRVSSNGAG